jgi:hypothetical protein
VKRIREAEDHDLLNGWKQIAAHLGCSEKTAQRWAKAGNLPILKPVSRSKKPPVLASKRALNAWLKGGIEHALLTGIQLIALDKQARILWSHEFSEPLRNYTPEELEWRLRIVDLDGGGERGVLFAARFLTQSNPDTLFYFSPTGKLEWQLEAEPPLRDRTGQPFDRAWTYTHVVTVPAAKGAAVWAAMANLAGWAGCVLRVGAEGSAAVQFANTGYVERLCPVSLTDGDFIIACGENNDYDDAFVALFGTHDPPACSVPGERLVYRYANTPPGRPAKYILFPKTELILARQKPYGHAMRIAQHLDGIIVEVETGGEDAYLRYHFSKDLEPRYVFPSGSHECVHQSLEKSGAISHMWLDCPEVQTPLVLRIWEPDSGWYERPIPWRDNPWKELQTAPDDYLAASDETDQWKS